LKLKKQDIIFLVVLDGFKKFTIVLNNNLKYSSSRLNITFAEFKEYLLANENAKVIIEFY